MTKTTATKTEKTRSDVAKASRRKGKRGERKLAKLLEQWWGSEFHSTPASGALRWKGMSRATRGDLISDDESFPFCIEVKNRECWTHQSFLSGAGPLFNWYQQAARDAEVVNRIPLLFVTKNHQPYFVIYKPLLMKKFRGKEPRRHIVSGNSQVGRLCFALLDDFIENHPKELLKEAH